MITAHGTFKMARRALDNPLKRFHFASMDFCLLFPLLIFKPVGDVQDFVHGYVMPRCGASPLRSELSTRNLISNLKG